MAGVKECIPSGAGVYMFSGRGRIPVDWENHANGAAAMRHDVRRSRVSHVTHDTSRVSLELTHTHALLRRSRHAGGSVSVVPHVTTLRTRDRNCQAHDLPATWIPSLVEETQWNARYQNAPVLTPAHKWRAFAKMRTRVTGGHSS